MKAKHTRRTSSTLITKGEHILFRPENHCLADDDNAKACPQCKKELVSLPGYPGDWFDCEGCGSSWEATGDQVKRMSGIGNLPNAL